MSLKKSVCLVSIIIAMNGCARSQELITSGSISTRTDVFTEISGTEILPGQAALYIYTSFKKADHSSVLLDHNKLGSSDVTLLINIDGQALQLKGSVRTEKRKAKGLHDPEAGEGLRYIFTTEVQLPAGSHRIIVALPAGGIAVEREINLAVGSKNNLTLVPNYYRSGARQKHDLESTKFTEGIQSMTVKFNGHEL